ncbi:hypothetical protein M011DRAFT_460531 [Sporormia fimetaria CBS 119925]|uniref:Uncharacterized protein n=1 Tax=Sporormia fimetaria CBS 119925 TaxID=1340428 RepID=A0A6A6V3W7_9PLEO|nr:hypothetical protein M011DRAFT_460531 [Sporormia fimetaria CBS 119925]
MSDTEGRSPTPRSPAATEGHALKRPKDRKCPFCEHYFTSSSLGRHLDVFIRSENPKAPDGVHIVEEIREMRGRITRRNMNVKTGGKKRSASHQSGGRVKSEKADPFSGEKAVAGTQEKAHTGVPSVKISRTPEARRDRLHTIKKARLADKQKASQTIDDGKAVELALKELLKSVREASARAAGSALFDFDPCAFSFPALCLRILPSPPTLSSPTPFPTSESWSITPPGHTQFEAVKRQLKVRIHDYKRQHQLQRASDGASLPTTPLSPPLLNPEPEKLFQHLEDAYRHWTARSEQQRQREWQLEILRSFVRVDSQRVEVEANLQKAKEEIADLRTAMNLSATEGAPVIRYSLDAEIVKELGRKSADIRDWNYDHLISKWRSVLRRQVSISGLAAQKPLPGSGMKDSGSRASLPSTATNGRRLRVTIPPNPYASAPTTARDSDSGSDNPCADGEDLSSDEDADADFDAEGEEYDQDAEADEGIHDEEMDTGVPAHGADLDPDRHRPVGDDMDPDADMSQMSHESVLVHHSNPEILVQSTPPHPQQLHQLGIVHQSPQYHDHSQAQAHARAQAEAHHAHMVQAQVAQAQAEAHMAQAQAQAWVAAHQQLNQSPHHHSHSQLSPLPLSPMPLLSPHSHMGSAANSRRGSYAFLESGGISLNASSIMPMSGPETQQPFLHIDVGLPAAYGNPGIV